MIERIRKFFKGNVRIGVSGHNRDRFLNICASRGYYIWELEANGQEYEMNMGIREFKELRPLARKCNVHVSVRQKNGLPFLLYKNRHRKFLTAGFLTGSMILLVLSLFVWNIEILGNQKETTEAIFQYLKEENIYFGSLKNTIDCKALSAELRREFAGFTWVSAKLKGTSLIIEVKENETQVAESIEALPISDLVAEVGGIIEKIVTRNGVPMVKAGDRVETGDLLVSGEVPVYNDAGELTGYQYCGADADIRIKTVYTYHDSFPLKYQERVYTGNRKKGFYMKTIWGRFGWNPGRNAFEEYDEITQEWQMGLSRYFKLPVSIGRIEAREYIIESRIYEPDVAKNKMQQNFLKNLEKIQEKGVQIFQNNVKIEVDGQNCTANGCLVLIHDTGKRVERTILDR